jgi:hypothetical protein
LHALCRSAILARVRLGSCLVLALAGVVLVSSAAASLAAMPPPELRKRMLKAGELRGFVPESPSQALVATNAAEWASGGGVDPAAETKRLRELGFVSAAVGHLYATRLTGRDAISVVLRFRTAAGAQADVAHTIRTYGKGSGVPVTQSAVPGIPGARVFVAKRPDGVGYDVVFSDGPYSYDVGAFTPEPKGRPTRADVVAAAKRLYQRVHGLPSG